ncbi:MAG: Uma2 family endonuclease [Bacteroidota bacterium]
MTKPISKDDTADPRFTWTVTRYEHAIETGVFTEDDKIELLYGEIIKSMSAGPDHEYCVTIIADFLRGILGNKYHIREEKSLLLEEEQSLPEPDITVIAKKDYSNQRPRTEDLHLIVEVSNSSLNRDRTIKAELYAEAGLAEYWIVNLINRQIEVHLHPDSAQRIFGSVNIYKEGNTFESPFAGEVVVKELLPTVS